MMEALTEGAMSKSLLVQAQLLAFLAGLFPVLTMQGQAVKATFRQW
jgi:hypothetical protein